MDRKQIYSNPSKLANFGGKKIGDREFGNRELGCYFTSKKSIWGFSVLNNKNREFGTASLQGITVYFQFIIGMGFSES